MIEKLILGLKYFFDMLLFQLKTEVTNFLEEALCAALQCQGDHLEGEMLLGLPICTATVEI